MKYLNIPRGFPSKWNPFPAITCDTYAAMRAQAYEKKQKCCVCNTSLTRVISLIDDVTSAGSARTALTASMPYLLNVIDMLLTL